MRRSHLSLFTHAPLVRALGFSSRPSLSQNSQCLESLHLFPLCPHLYLPHPVFFCVPSPALFLWSARRNWPLG